MKLLEVTVKYCEMKSSNDKARVEPTETVKVSCTYVNRGRGVDFPKAARPKALYWLLARETGYSGHGVTV